MPSLAELLGLAPILAPWDSNLYFPPGPAIPDATPWWLQSASPSASAPISDAARSNVTPPADLAPNVASGGWLGDILAAGGTAKSSTPGGILQGAVPDTGQDASSAVTLNSRLGLPLTGLGVADLSNRSVSSRLRPFSHWSGAPIEPPQSSTASNLLVPSPQASWGAPLPLFSTGVIADNPNAREQGGDSAVLSDASPAPWIANAQYANLRGRRSGRRASERELTPIEEIRWTLFHHNLDVLGRFDPRNPLLFRYTAPDWVPSDRDNEEIRQEIARARVEQNARHIERQHNLPREIEAQFRACGLDPERFITYIPRDLHRFRPDGLHTGPLNWNSEWRQFFRQRQDQKVSDEEVLKQLLKMWRTAPWLKR